MQRLVWTSPTINGRETIEYEDQIKIDSFEMKLDRKREREILHSLEILMDSYAKIDVSRSDDNCGKT